MVHLKSKFLPKHDLKQHSKIICLQLVGLLKWPPKANHLENIMEFLAEETSHVKGIFWCPPWTLSCLWCWQYLKKT